MHINGSLWPCACLCHLQSAVIASLLFDLLCFSFLFFVCFISFFPCLFYDHQH